MPGKCNLEIRPKFVNKGEIAKRLVEKYREEALGVGFVLCAGDDTTDEGEFNLTEPFPLPIFSLVSRVAQAWFTNSLYDLDMFKSLRESSLPQSEFFTVHIGPSSKHTIADYHLLEPSDMIESVGLLVGIVNPVDLGIVSAVIETSPASSPTTAAGAAPAKKEEIPAAA